eukprot:364902-Pyramimonas_sp.AAC.3
MQFRSPSGQLGGSLDFGPMAIARGSAHCGMRRSGHVLRDVFSPRSPWFRPSPSNEFDIR